MAAFGDIWYVSEWWVGYVEFQFVRGGFVELGDWRYVDWFSDINVADEPREISDFAKGYGLEWFNFFFSLWWFWGVWEPCHAGVCYDGADVSFEYVGFVF